MKLDFYEMMFSIMLPIVFGLMAIFFFYIGLRSILTKRPYLISNRWELSIMFVVFIPSVLLSLSSPSGFNVINWVHPLFIGVVLLMMCYELKGYAVYAVTDTSFRGALLAALQKLQMPYEESLSLIRLTSINADLQVAVQSWSGTGVIKVKKRAHLPVLREVVNAMNEYFRKSSAARNMIFCVYYLVAGGIMVAFAIGMFFLGRNYGAF